MWTPEDPYFLLSLQKGEELPEPIEEVDDYHDQWCRFCRDGGDVILCDFCELVYHKECLNPPLEAVPEDEWKCPVCEVQTRSQYDPGVE